MNAIATLTARTKAGKEYPVCISANANGVHAEINGTYVTLSTTEGKPVVKLSKDAVRKILGIDAPNGGAIVLAQDWKSLVQAHEAAEKESAMYANITGFTYIIGCDAPSTYSFSYDYPAELGWDAKYARIQKDKKLANILTNTEIVELAGKLNAKTLDPDGMSYGGYVFGPEILPYMTAKLETKLAEKAAQNAEYQAIENEKFAEAKRTGKPVQLSSYMVECNGRVEDCSFDTLTVYAMPDGSRKEEQHHCH